MGVKYHAELKSSAPSKGHWRPEELKSGLLWNREIDIKQTSKQTNLCTLVLMKYFFTFVKRMKVVKSSIWESVVSYRKQLQLSAYAY